MPPSIPALAPTNSRSHQSTIRFAYALTGAPRNHAEGCRAIRGSGHQRRRYRQPPGTAAGTHSYLLTCWSVMDLTQLSRSQADLPKLIDRLVHRGVRVVGVQDGYDSARKGHKLQAGLTGIMGEAFREMISEKTYSALESRAQRGESAGGVSYGYRDGEAAVIRQIFELYAGGVSPRGIVDRLNREAVPVTGCEVESHGSPA